MPVVRLPRSVLVLIAAISVVRFIAASRVPLLPDETDYWTWSRHVAFSYTDHPPAVAWLIALTAPFGDAPGVVRLPFIVCEAVTALALGETALLLAGNAAAGSAAALAFAFVPQSKLALGEALPDGPYVMCWALALWAAALLERNPTPLAAVRLGAALGGAVLSRFFGWALVIGIAAYALAPRRRHAAPMYLLACAVAVALYVPFLISDAAHGWANMRFTFAGRHGFHGLSAASGDIAVQRFMWYVVAFWIVAYVVALRPRLALVAWTALPFPTALAILAAIDTGEAYWLLGPFASLCVGIGIAVGRLGPVARRALGIAAALPLAATTVAVLFGTLAEPAQAAVLRALGPGAKGPLYNAVFVFPSLAEQVRGLTAAQGGEAMTDRLEIAAELRYYGIPAVMAGNALQVAQWNDWYAAGRPRPAKALVVTYAPLDTPAEVSLAAQLRQSYARVGRSTAHTYTYAGTSSGTFYLTWCAGPQ